MFALPLFPFRKPSKKGVEGVPKFGMLHSPTVDLNAEVVEPQKMETPGLNFDKV